MILRYDIVDPQLKISNTFRKKALIVVRTRDNVAEPKSVARHFWVDVLRRFDSIRLGYDWRIHLQICRFLGEKAHSLSRKTSCFFFFSCRVFSRLHFRLSLHYSAPWPLLDNRLVNSTDSPKSLKLFLTAQNQKLVFQSFVVGWRLLWDYVIDPCIAITLEWSFSFGLAAFTKEIKRFSGNEQIHHIKISICISVRKIDHSLLLLLLLSFMNTLLPNQIKRRNVWKAARGKLSR